MAITTMVSANDISGLWQHSEKPAWIQISFSDNYGKATITRHDLNANAKGLTIITEIIANQQQPNLWQGKMYSAAVDGFVDAKLTMPDEQTIIITVVDDKQSEIEILRLMKTPHEPSLTH